MPDSLNSLLQFSTDLSSIEYIEALWRQRRHELSLLRHQMALIEEELKVLEKIKLELSKT